MIEFQQCFNKRKCNALFDDSVFIQPLIRYESIRALLAVDAMFFVKPEQSTGCDPNDERVFG